MANNYDYKYTELAKNDLESALEYISTTLCMINKTPPAVFRQAVFFGFIKSIIKKFFGVFSSVALIFYLCPENFVCRKVCTDKNGKVYCNYNCKEYNRVEIIFYRECLHFEEERIE